MTGPCYTRYLWASPHNLSDPGTLQGLPLWGQLSRGDLKLTGGTAVF
jgi:hypothetical protein